MKGFILLTIAAYSLVHPGKEDRPYFVTAAAPLNAAWKAGIFEGRIPCINVLLALNKISPEDCNRIKLRLTLHEDIKGEGPKAFTLMMVYVGAGDTQYSTKGTLTILRGTKANPAAVVYKLSPDNFEQSLFLQQGDQNILLFLDDEKNLLVGNESLSFTLNRVNTKH